jgi:hypothetical protein
MAKRWTSQDIVYLVTNYVTLGSKKVAIALSRTQAAVYSKYSTEKNKIHNIKPFPTLIDVIIDDPFDDGYVELGEIFTLTATVKDINNPNLTISQKVKWSSSDENVVIVDGDTGVCEVICGGSCELICTSVLDPTKMDSTSVSVTVVTYLKLLSIKGPDDVTITLDIPYSFDLTVTYANGFKPLHCDDSRVTFGKHIDTWESYDNYSINTVTYPVTILSSVIETFDIIIYTSKSDTKSKIIKVNVLEALPLNQ